MRVKRLTGVAVRPGEARICPGCRPAIAEFAARLDVIDATVSAMLAKPPHTCPADIAYEGLLRVIWNVIGAGSFCGRDVFSRVRVARDAELRAVLQEANAATPRELGWLLRHLEGRTLGEFSVRRVDECRAGLIWRVSRVSS